MMDVYCDNSITDYVRRLRHPVFLKGALIGDGFQEPKIYIKRTMTEKGTIRLSLCVCVRTAEWNIIFLYVQVLCVYTVNVYACTVSLLSILCIYVFNVHVNQVQY